jgi:photosystem II stability/assembly factor-like uncharacterized protein
VVRSTDRGATWASVASGLTYTLYDICWTGSRFAAAGYYIGVATSDDGTSWASASLPSGRFDGTAIERVGDLTWAVGGVGMLISSDQGLTWALDDHVAPPALPSALEAVGPAGSTSAVAVGASGTVLMIQPTE